MPVLPPAASDVTRFRRLNAEVGPTPDFRVRAPSYSAVPRFLFGSVLLASDVSKEISPNNSVLGPPKPTVVPGPFSGSLFFDRYYDLSGNTTIASWIKIDQLSPTALSPGTGDFTIEWWQYLSNTSPNFPRIFSLGIDVIGVSIENPQGNSRTLYVWLNEDNVGAYTVSITDVWAHIAIVRKNGIVSTYLNGASLGSFSYGNSLQSNGSLIIGGLSSTNVNPNEVFEGYITNFSWVVGTAVYTSNFTPPSENIASVPGQRVLLWAKSAPNAFVNSAPSGFVFINLGNTPQWSGLYPPNTPP